MAVRVVVGALLSLASVALASAALAGTAVAHPLGFESDVTEDGVTSFRNPHGVRPTLLEEAISEPRIAREPRP